MNKLNTIFFEAAKNSDWDILDKCIDAGADVDVKDDDGKTALMKASNWGHTDIVELLRNGGATGGKKKQKKKTKKRKSKKSRKTRRR